MEKYEFSQEDYVMYEFHFVNEKRGEIVGTASKIGQQKHDKTFKEVLKDKEILKLMNKKERLPMEDWIERMKANRRKEDRELRRKAVKEGRAEGIKEAITLIIKNMLKENQDENTIIRVTNAKKEDIEAIRKELKIQEN